MKINASPELLVDRGTAGTGSPVKSPAAPGGKRTAADRLEVSELGARLGAIRRELTAQAEFDARRVEAVQKEVSRGTYIPDPDAIAEKMLQSARELLPRKA